jgi:hypothetical protein
LIKELVKLFKNKKKRKWTDKILAHARWFKEIGPAQDAEQRLTNCLLNRMVQDRFIAEIATETKILMAAAETTIAEEISLLDQRYKAIGLALVAAPLSLNFLSNRKAINRFIAVIVTEHNALTDLPDADSKL